MRLTVVPQNPKSMIEQDNSTENIELIGHHVNLTVSNACPADAAAILQVLEKTATGLAAQGKNHWNGKHTLSSVLESFAASEVLLVRDSTQNPVATITISSVAPSIHLESDQQFWRSPNTQSSYIRRLAVIPSAQGQGIASELLKLAERRAKNSGSEFARLDTDPKYPEIVNYYIDRGYQKMGVRDGRSFFEKELKAV